MTLSSGYLSIYLMPRLIFSPGTLSDFIQSARNAIPLKREELAQELGISGRTLADWQREKFFPDQTILIKLSQLANIPLPTPIEIREDWWSACQHAHLGGIRHQQIYGCTLTHQDRVKGGTNSQQRRKDNPEYYKKLGCNIRKTFKYPRKDNPSFAEFIGIMLGDGHLGQNGQIQITLNSIADKQYIFYVQSLIKKLFGQPAGIHKVKSCNAKVVYLTGKDVVDFLLKSGMRHGNKTKIQVDVPNWIKKNKELSIQCVKGLMDTDGGIFVHKYKVNGKYYSYYKLQFCSTSQPLRHFVHNTLIQNNFSSKMQGSKHVWLYSQDETKQYLQVIGSSNPRLLNKIK